MNKIKTIFSLRNHKLWISFKQSFVILSAVFAIFLLSGYLLYALFGFGKKDFPGIVALVVTNQTDSSVTIVWQSDEEINVSVVVNNLEFYDSRDIVNVYSLDKKSTERGKRLTHSVNIKNLEPDTEYSFKIKHGSRFVAYDVDTFRTAPVIDSLSQPELIYGYVFDSDGLEITDAVVLFYAESEGKLSQPLSMYVSKMGSFTLDVSSIRDANLRSRLDLPEVYWQYVYVWSEHGELIRRVDSRYSKPIGGIGTQDDRLQYGRSSSNLVNSNSSLLSTDSSGKFHFVALASQAAPSCASGDSSHEVFGDCCGDGKAREIRRCVDAASGVYYYKFGSCVHEAAHCRVSFDSVCNNNGIRDCTGYSQDNCEGGVDCGNSVCGPCAASSNGGIPDHCFNGEKDDGWEEGVDCGGACPSCPGRSLAAEKSDACPPEGCVAPENIPSRSDIEQEGGGVSQSPGMVDARCGKADTRSACVDAFGEGGCNVVAGGVCEWNGSWNNCVYGYTCISGKCLQDNAVSACWGRRNFSGGIPLHGLEATYNMSWEEAWAELVRLNPEYANVEFVTYSDEYIGSSNCIAGDNFVHCNYNSTLESQGQGTSDQRKLALLTHEVGHIMQHRNAERYAHTYTEDCVIASPTGTFTCGDWGEVGAEVFSGNGGGYVFEDQDGNMMCGTEVYDRMVASVGSTNAVDRFFDRDCSVWDRVTSNYDFCNAQKRVVCYDMDCQQRKVDYYRDVCAVHNYVPVSNTSAQGAMSTDKNLYSLWRFLNASKVLAYEEDGVKYSGEYLVEISDGIGGSKEFRYASLHADREIKLFQDLNKDGRRQSDEPFIDDMQVKLYPINHHVEYLLNSGWNSFALPMELMDDSENKIITAQQFLEYVQSKGLDITQLAKYKDGVWVVATRRGRDQISDDFELVAGEGYFLRSYSVQELTLKGYMMEGSVPVDLSVGWNLVSIVNPSRNNYTAGSLLKEFEKKSVEGDIITKWDNGRYVSYITDNDRIYGEDFGIYPTKSYWVRIYNRERVVFEP